MDIHKNARLTVHGRQRIVRQVMSGQTPKAVALAAGATVSRVLRRLGLSKLSALEPEPVRRYEREKPGELIHIDIKKLGRIGSVGHRITGRQTNRRGQPSPRHWVGVCPCLYRRRCLGIEDGTPGRKRPGRPSSKTALAVEPQQVVLGKAEAADGQLGADTAMRPMPVVAMKPSRQFGCAFVGSVVSTSVSPFA